MNGVNQTAIQGISPVYSFADAGAPAQRKTQQCDVDGSGGICHDGWKASFGYRPDFVDPIETYPKPKSAENKAGKGVWDLYNVNEDPTERNDLTQPAAHSS